MTEKELNKHSIIKDLINKKINGPDASKLLEVTVRQVQRLKALVLKYGAQGLAHKNRGRKSNRKLDQEILDKVKVLLKEKYFDFGPTFATEKIEEIDQIKIGKETVRSIMIGLNLWQVKPRRESKSKWHIWRARKDNYGEMQQFDGSYYVWFGDEESCLLLAVDDATGKITYAKFDINESRVAVFKFWLEYILLNGLPISIYLDKFSTYKVNHKNAVDDKGMITQFQRAMCQLGVNVITANTPQAKGRVERMNETLQDRLVKELRLAGIKTRDEANEFLKSYVPKFNAKFAVAPNRRNDLHKKLASRTINKLPQIFSIQEERVVNNDYTLRFEGSYYQLDRIQPTTVYKKDRIIVEKHLSGEIKLRLREAYLNYKLLPERPKKEIEVKLVALTRQIQGSYKVPVDHPWSKQFLSDKRQIEQKIQVPK